MFSSCLCGEHGQNACTTPNIKDDLILEKVLIVVHRVAVSQCPHLILQHFFVDTKVGIGVEVIILKAKCYILNLYS